METSPIKILVVDDENNIRALVQRILVNEGYDVITAKDGNEAMDIVRNSEIDVMILDLRMPGMSGMEVLREVTTGWPEICVLMLTAIDDLNTAIEAMKCGAYDYVTKPFKRDELVNKIHEAIKRSKLDIENTSEVGNLSKLWSTGLSPEDWQNRNEDR